MTTTTQRKKLTASDLKFYYEQAQGGHFFTRDSMKFFGDTMANYGVRAQTEFVQTYHQKEPIECYVLYRRKKTSKGMYKSAYFACSDFEVIHKAEPIPEFNWDEYYGNNK